MPAEARIRALEYGNCVEVASSPVETRMEFAGHPRADDEAARLDPCDLGYCPSSEGIGERRNHAREKTLVDEQTPDVRMPVDPSKPR